MIINRNNYEEFFLLYVDNELSAAERKAVDLFVSENPDLQEELLMFQQTVLKPSVEIFEDKTALLKADPLLQENLLLLLDGELSEPAKLEITSAIRNDLTVAAEWNLLQQTKLDADESIVFTDKQSLYRKEEPARVVGIRWWRIAAAAALIGFGTWGTISYLNNNKTTVITTAGKDKENVPGNSIVVTKEKVDRVNKVDIVNTNDSVIPPVNINQTNIDQKQSLVKNNLPVQQKKQSLPVERIIKEEPKENDVVVKQNSKEDKPTNNLPKPLQNINSIERNETGLASVTPKKNETINVVPENRNASFSSNKNSEPNNNASYAVNKTTESVEGDEEPDDKKSKLRGLFRKVKRVLERNSNAKSNSNVMIAGFGIAIK